MTVAWRAWGETKGRGSGCHLSFIFMLLRLWLTVGSSSINKVFRRSAVCSPFPSLSECLSVSVCYARSKCCWGVNTSGIWLKAAKWLSKIVLNKSTMTEMLHSWFIVCVGRESASVIIQKIGACSFSCMFFRMCMSKYENKLIRDRSKQAVRKKL